MVRWQNHKDLWKPSIYYLPMSRAATLQQENVDVQATIISIVRGLLGARAPTEVRFFFFFLFVAERPVQLVWMDSRSFAF